MARRQVQKIKKAPINSRKKGAVGELEFANMLKLAGIDARRGQQFSGGKDSPDVVTDLTDVHFEVKRKESGNLYEWYEQAKTDGIGKLSIVAHRRNGAQWLAILDMHDLLDLLILREGTLL